MSIKGTICSVPDPSNKIVCIKKMREAVIDANGDYLGLKGAKEACDVVFGSGTLRYEFPNRESVERMIAAGFGVKDVTGIASGADEKTLMIVRQLLQDSLDNDDVEAFDALTPAFRLFLKRNKP